MVEVTGSSMIDVTRASTSVESDEKEGEYGEPGDLFSLLRRRRRFLEDERGGGGANIEQGAALRRPRLLASLGT